jgi:hypothetical protein
MCPNFEPPFRTNHAGTKSKARIDPANTIGPEHAMGAQECSPPDR